MADEIEIKLAVPPERAGEVRRLELLRRLAEKRGSTRQLSTVYFDTPDQALAKRGIALRIRSAGRRKLQTIKLPAEGPGGLQIQREVETPVSGDRPEFDRISDLRLRRLFTHGGIADGLAPLFADRIQALRLAAALQRQPDRVRLRPRARSGPAPPVWRSRRSNWS